MTAHTVLPNSLFLQDKPILGSTGMALRDNVVAAAEAADDAPVLVAGWHPYDMVNIGDGADGVFYDFAIDGTQATITTPDFADGYEYAIRFANLGCDATSVTLNVALYRETDAAYTTVWTSANTTDGAAYGWVEIHAPRVAGTDHFVTARATMANIAEAKTSGFWAATVQKILRARISWSSGHGPASIDAGTARLYRRGMQG